MVVAEAPVDDFQRWRDSQSQPEDDFSKWRQQAEKKPAISDLQMARMESGLRASGEPVGQTVPDVGPDTVDNFPSTADRLKQQAAEIIPSFKVATGTAMKNLGAWGRQFQKPTLEEIQAPSSIPGDTTPVTLFGVNKPQPVGMEKAGQSLAQSGTKELQDVLGSTQPNVADYLAQGIGGLPPAVAGYGAAGMLGGPFGMGAYGALSGEPTDIGKNFVSGTALGTILNGVNEIPGQGVLPSVGRGLASGAAFGGVGAAERAASGEPQDLQKTLADVILGGGMGMMGRGRPVESAPLPDAPQAITGAARTALPEPPPSIVRPYQEPARGLPAPPERAQLPPPSGPQALPPVTPDIMGVPRGQFMREEELQRQAAQAQNQGYEDMRDQQLRKMGVDLGVLAPEDAPAGTKQLPPPPADMLSTLPNVGRDIIQGQPPRPTEDMLSEAERRVRQIQQQRATVPAAESASRGALPSAGAKQPWEKAGLDQAPNMRGSATEARKDPDGSWRLFYRGTRNEVFFGERFSSAREAKGFFNSQMEKMRSAQQPEAKTAESEGVRLGVDPELIHETARAIMDREKVQPPEAYQRAITSIEEGQQNASQVRSDQGLPNQEGDAGGSGQNARGEDLQRNAQEGPSPGNEQAGGQPVQGTPGQGELSSSQEGVKLFSGIPDWETIQKSLGDALKAGKWTVDHIGDAARWLYQKYGDGVRTIGDAASKLKDAFGEGIGPHVQKIWQTLKKYLSGSFEFSTPKSVFDSKAPVSQPLLDKFLKAVQGLKPDRFQMEKLKSEERSRRAAIMEKILSGNLKGEAAYREMRRAMSGEYPSVAPGERVGAAFSPAEREALVEHILRHNTLEGRSFTKQNVVNSVLDLLDRNMLPTEGDIAQIENLFGPKIGSALLGKQSGARKALRYASDTFGLTKAMKYSADLSATLRQGFALTVSHPVEAAKAYAKQIRAFGNAEYADKVMKDLQNGPMADVRRQAGLQLTATHEGLNAKEEAFYTNLFERWHSLQGKNAFGKAALAVPKLIGSGVRASERAYVTYLNSIRTSVFDGVASDIITDRTLSDAQRQDMLSRLAKEINAATGRANVSTRFTGEGANMLFSSPKFILSRFEYPVRAALESLKGDRVGREAARQLVTQAGAYLALYALINSQDKKHVFDTRPTSGMFGKVKAAPHTSVDVGAGEAQTERLVARLLAKLAGGKMIDANTGQLKSINAKDELSNFLMNKLAPLPSTAVSTIQGRDPGGQKMTPGKILSGLTVPIPAENIPSLVRDVGLPKAIPLELLDIHGLGVNTYQPPPPKPRKLRD